MSPKIENVTKIILTFLVAGFLSGSATILFGGGFLPGFFFGLAISMLTKGQNLKTIKLPYSIVSSASTGYLAMCIPMFIYGAFFFMDEGDDIVSQRGFLKIMFFSSWIVSTMFLNVLRKDFNLFNIWIMFVCGLACALFAVALVVIITGYSSTLDSLLGVGVAVMIWQTVVGSILVYQIDKHGIKSLVEV